MKWIILIALLGSLGPLTMFLRSQPKYLLHACFFMGLLVFFLDPYLNISPDLLAMDRGREGLRDLDCRRHRLRNPFRDAVVGPLADRIEDRVRNLLSRRC